LPTQTRTFPSLAGVSNSLKYEVKLKVSTACARFTGDQDIVLKMPPGVKVSDLK